LTSYHDFNKEEKTPILLTRLQEGAHIALVSDAGTPLISDPGYYLVKHATNAKIPVVPIPGPSAVLGALAVSGLPTDAFVFTGFLPRKTGARTKHLVSLSQEQRTIVLFETPHRLRSTLEAIHEIFGQRRIVITRELTKLHEEIIRGEISEILATNPFQKPRGEFTLVIEGNRPQKKMRGFEQQSL
jgi:16S rRNA (cytidine1402-2'-O)-methyltransferase